MASAPNPAAQIAAVYIDDLKQGRMSAESVISVLRQRITELDNPSNQQSEADTAAQRKGYQEALSYAEKQIGQNTAAAKSGSSQAAAKSSAASQQQAALKSEGQPSTLNNPNSPGAGSSVYGSLYQNNSVNLNNAGLGLLANAVGSKFSFMLNDKVNPGNLKGLGALSSIVNSKVTIGTILLSLMQNQDQSTVLAIQTELAKAGYLDPLHTTNLTPGFISQTNDPTLQALASVLQSAQERSLSVSSLIKTGQQSRQGQDWGKLWDSVVSGAPFSITGDQTSVQSAGSLADQLRQATTGAGSVTGGSQSVLGGGAGMNPNNDETQEFISAAQQYEKNNPTVVTTQYEPQPGLGISGFTRFPLQKNSTSVGGVDQAAMDQFTYNWLINNFGPQVSATGAANLLGAFNQLLGLGNAGTGSAPSSAAGGS